jgi:ATP-binding cassette, subfamily B, bacterial
VSANLTQLLWPLSRLSQALRQIADRRNVPQEIPPPPCHCDFGTLSRWIESAGSCLGFEAVYSTPECGSLEQVLSSCGAALIQVCSHPEPHFAVLLGGGKQKVTLLGPDLQIHRLSQQVLIQKLLQEFEGPHVAAVDRTIERAKIPNTRKGSVRRALLRDRLARTQLTGWWFLQLRPGAHPLILLRASGLGRQMAGFLGAHFLQVALWVASWYLVGYAALLGRMDTGWLAGWALLLLTLVPLRLLAARFQARIATTAGILFRRQLLNGAMNQRLDEIRHQGVGQLLGRVIEFETVELLSLSGGLTVAVALAELVLALMVLSRGEGGLFGALLLLAWAGVTAVLVWRYYAQRKNWTDDRLEMTHTLVENLVGYRTRLVQEDRTTSNASADRALEQYLRLSHGMDQSSILLWLIPRGWLLLGLLAMAPAFVSGQHSMTLLAVALGGTLLAQSAFESLAAGLPQLAGALIAWKKVSPLIQAGADPSRPDAKSILIKPKSDKRPCSPGRPLVQASNLSFRYRDRGEPVIQDGRLTVRHGDRILLQGVSGGGKSTLASLISGFRVPDSGTLFLRGLDRHTLGYAGWRDHVATAPQFHENFVFANTLAFNLLLGRAWPPSAKDLEEANQVCRELGLANLIARMPGGLFQLVGETGWQLSHGERSRLFIARALLRNSDLLILDESFSALDPATLQDVLGCVLNRARTLLVISHS